VKLLREKDCMESQGFDIGIAQDKLKLLRTWRERGCNNTEGVHILQGHESLLAA
jgi:hypothetical protein